MNELVTKNVPFCNSELLAVKEQKTGRIYAGINSVLRELGFSDKQIEYRRDKWKDDKVLSKGILKFSGTLIGAGTGKDTWCIEVMKLPLALAKIEITQKMKREMPDLTDKLEKYQENCADVLADAFLENVQTPPLTLQQQIQTIAKGTDELYQRVDDIQAEVKALKDDMPVFLKDTKDIQNALRKKAIEVLGGKDSNAYHDRSIHAYTFADIQIELRRQFGVRRYDQIRHKDVPDALKIIEEYKPPLHIRDKIAMANAQQSLELEGGVR